jgi:SAM-dependent methyltransferase
MNKSELIKKIKEKPELSGLSDSVVLKNLESYLSKYKITLDSLSPSQIKILVKEIRSELRKLTGRFQKSLKKRKFDSTADFEEILKTHTSTAERLDFYPELKKRIIKLNPKSILDLGCGLNPLALADKKAMYYASDIKEDEIEIIKEFFKKNKIKGRAFIHDLRNTGEQLPKADLCLIFKVLDIVDKKNHATARKILENVNCKKFLISFSTKKISGRPMTHPQRIWFEKTLKNLNYPFEKFSSKNEIFYLAYKKSGPTRD